MLVLNYHDADQLGEALSGELEMHVTQLRPGPCWGSLARVDLPNVTVIRGNVSNHVEVVAAPYHDLAVLIGHPGCCASLNGHALERDQVVTTYRHRDHHLKLVGPYECWMLLARHAILAGLSGPWRQQLMIRESGDLARFCEQIVPRVKAMPESSRQGWSARLIELLSNALQEGHRQENLEGLSVRRQAALEAAQVIARRPCDPLPLQHLAEQVHVSERTLRHGFHEVFDMSPTEYLRAYRMTRVRRQLRLGQESQTSVASVAARWGFWHMPRFASEYRRFFGELPSQTLRRRVPPLPILDRASAAVGEEPA